LFNDLYSHLLGAPWSATIGNTADIVLIDNLSNPDCTGQYQVTLKSTVPSVTGWMVNPNDNSDENRMISGISPHFDIVCNRLDNCALCTYDFRVDLVDSNNFDDTLFNSLLVIADDGFYMSRKLNYDHSR
jgi:hypothetical protein